MHPAPHTLTGPTDGPHVCYTFVRHLGFILDELSSQGLELWYDAERGWCWRWRERDLSSERGLWAMGEALVDAVLARYPGLGAEPQPPPNA